MQPPDLLVVGALVAADQQGHGEMSPPQLPWSDAGQVRTFGILGFWALTVIPVPASAVLVRHGSPAPVGQRAVRDDAELLRWVDAARRDGAQVQPAVTEVELVDELLAGLEPPEGEPASVEHGVVSVVPLWVGLADPVSAGEVELVQMASVPAGERVIDRARQLNEGVGAGGGEDPSRPGPQLIAVALDEVHPDRQPGAAHLLIFSDGGGLQRLGRVCGEFLGALQRTADPFDFQFATARAVNCGPRCSLARSATRTVWYLMGVQARSLAGLLPQRVDDAGKLAGPGPGPGPGLGPDVLAGGDDVDEASSQPGITATAACTISVRVRCGRPAAAARGRGR